MATRYTMKALHTPTSKYVYWTTVGSSDLVGTYSGYDPSDLSGIVLDYTSTQDFTPVPNVSISELAGGDLDGTYPDPTVIALRGHAVGTAIPSSNNILTWDGTAWQPLAPTGNFGATGPMGPTGSVGATGIQGPTGPAGTTGVTGPAGATGPIGPVGATGPTGPIGPAGATGAVGPIGTGTSLPSGSYGAIWYQGATAVQSLGPGVSGTILSAQGSGSAPIWITNTGGGGGGATGPQGATGPAGATGPQGPTGPAIPFGAIGYRNTDPDSDTLLRWAFEESASPYASSGSNILSLSPTGGSPTGIPGLFTNSIYFPATGYLTSGPSSVEPTNNSLTISCWVYVNQYTTNGTFLTKAYRNDGSWTSPFASFFMALSGANDGTWAPGMTIGGTFRQSSITDKIPLKQWTHIAGTYDGTNIRWYTNGIISTTNNVAGTLDYGTHGPWTSGANVIATDPLNGLVEEIRIENTVRSPSYLRDLYQKGIGLFSTYVGITGATGPQGPQGATGPAGATGPTGPQGATGPAGTSTGVAGTVIRTYATIPAAGVTGARFLTPTGTIEFIDDGNAYRPFISGKLGTTPPTASNWTVRTNGGISTSLVDEDGTLRFTFSNSGGAPEEVRIASKAAPSTPYRIEACLRALFPSRGIALAGIGVRESSSGSIELFASNYNSTSGAKSYARHRATANNNGTSPTYSFNNETTTYSNQVNMSGNIWLAMTRNSSGDRAYEVSSDGRHWTIFSQLGSTSNSFITPDEVVISAWVSSGTSGDNQGMILISWVEL